MIWIRIRHAARAETKAITASVMVVLNVNVRSRSLARPLQASSRNQLAASTPGLQAAHETADMDLSNSTEWE
jgi:hypothetical protein